MARRQSPALTDAELRIMRALWERRRATVSDVVTALGASETSASNAPAYNTVLTMLTILERKGYVTHEKDGRAFVYSPVVDGSQARRRALTHLLARFFDGSPELLVLDLLGHDRPDDAQRQRVRELLQHAAEQADPRHEPGPPHCREAKS